MSNQRLVFGFDIGTNSIGWAIIRENENWQLITVIAMGSKIFIRSVDDKTETSKMQARRKARLSRRVTQRRTRRKQRLMRFLVKQRLLPDELLTVQDPEKVLNDKVTRSSISSKINSAG